MKLALIKHVVAELAESLTGARVSKIYQPAPELILFKLWNGRETLRLLLSAEVQKSRLHLTTQTWPNPHIPPRFCQLLRARISRIETVSVVNNDRIVQFDCSGSQGNCRLLIELTGKSCNFFLLDDRELIIDLLKRVTAKAGERNISPGETYQFPFRIEVEEVAATGTVCQPDDHQSWNQTVEKLYRDREHSENKYDFYHQLQQTLHRQTKKLQKRLRKIEKELTVQKNSSDYRQIGDLLLANLHLLKRGMTEIELDNYYLQPPEMVKIELDALLLPAQNAEKYFKRYKKGSRGVAHSQRRLRETQVELAWLEQLEYQLKDRIESSDVEEIAEELRRAGLLKDKNRLHAKRTLQPSTPHETLSPSGLKILWGRNNRQNDEISTRILKPGDVWLHAKDVPGAHVVLKSDRTGKSISDEDLTYAAAIAAGYSKSRDGHKVEVMLANANSVHKPKGQKPGLVTVRHYKTLTVKPLRLG